MIPQQEKHQISLEKAKKSIQTADHLTYITFPLLKENKLLLKVLEEINVSLLYTINAILQYEYLYKRIPLYSNSRDNLNTFKHLATRYGISQEQLAKISEIMTITEKHKTSPFEFMKHDKIVIMSQSMEPDTLTLEKIKNYLIEVKDVIRKANIVLTGRKI